MHGCEQLKKVSYPDPKGIILCDGGTDMVHSRPHNSFDFNFNALDATKDFLRQNQSVDFVLLVSSVWIEDGKLGSCTLPVHVQVLTSESNEEYIALEIFRQASLFSTLRLYPPFMLR